MFAGYHYDLNFLTIHGRSRFPGLNIWLRNGQKVEVKVPVGCLLIQTGKQVRVLETCALVDKGAVSFRIWCFHQKAMGVLFKYITNKIFYCHI